MRLHSYDYFFRKNAFGDIIAIYDEYGNLHCTYTYDAWGNHTILGANGNIVKTGIGVINPFRYRGYYYDEEFGLYYLQSRYYDPEVGRFISADDVSYLAPQSIFGLNLYAYCNDNPVMYTDPSGRFVMTTAMIVGLIIGAVVGATVGGCVAYDKASEAGATGWELAGWTLLGVLGGGFAGGLLGMAAGWAAPSIGSFLGSTFTLAEFVTASGEIVTVSVTGGQAVAGTLGLLILFSQWRQGDWPGNDPTIPPGDGFEWRGKGPIGSDKGAWVNPSTGDFLHPDLNHPAPIGPHWDWINKILRIATRIFPH